MKWNFNIFNRSSPVAAAPADGGSDGQRQAAEPPAVPHPIRQSALLGYPAEVDLSRNGGRSLSGIHGGRPSDNVDEHAEHDGLQRRLLGEEVHVEEGSRSVLFAPAHGSDPQDGQIPQRHPSMW